MAKMCPKCEGNKKLVVQVATTSRRSVGVEVDCDQCKGMGTVGGKGVCKTCNGSKKSMKFVQLWGVNGVGIKIACPDCSSAATQ